MDIEIVENFVNQKKDMILSINNPGSGQRTNLKMLLHKSHINFEYFDITATDVFPEPTNIKSLKQTDSKTVLIDIDPSLSTSSTWIHLPEMIKKAKDDGLQVLVIVDNRTADKPKTNSDAYFFSSIDDLITHLGTINKGAELDENFSVNANLLDSNKKVKQKPR
jgi:hypothetical protein